MNARTVWAAPRRAVAWSWEHAPKLAAVVGIAALALEWTVRDGVAPLAVFYYALPMPVVAAALLVGLALALVRERRVELIACGVLLAACIATHRTTAFVTAAPPRTESARSLRGLLWNTWRARPGLAAMIREIRLQDPDLFVLVEPPVDAERNPLVRLRELMPEYRFGFFGRRFVIAARGQVGAPTDRPFDGGSAATVTLTIDDTEVRLLCVDVGSSPMRGRRGPLRQIAELAAPLAAVPALVLGDFNTPRRSVHFQSIRSSWAHAFEAAGNGYDATWPEPFPVFSIDHVWGSAGLTFTDCRIVPTKLSDHRLVVFDFIPRQ